MKLNALLDLGLSEAEAKLYLALLGLGRARASIVARNTGTKRTTVYAMLKSLVEKGFVVMYLHGNAQLYYAERPERVRNQFNKRLSSFTEFIPQLEAIAKKDAPINGLRRIESVSELKHFYGNILHDYAGKNYDIIGNRFSWQDLDKEFFVRFRRERAKAKIKTRLLLTHNSKSEDSLDNLPLKRTVKYLPAKYSFNSTIDIYRDKILIVSPDLSTLAVVIEMPAMTDVFKTIFDLLWEILPTTSAKKSQADQSVHLTNARGQKTRH